MENKRALSKSGATSVALTSEAFGKGMAIFEACFPRYRLGKSELDVWRFMLADLTEEQFVRGMKTFCLAHREIFPNTNIVAHLRYYAVANPKQKTAAEAWADVLKAIGNVGSYCMPSFDDIPTQRAVEAIGWKDICFSENIGVERAHFMRAYDEIVKRDVFNAVSGLEH